MPTKTAPVSPSTLGELDDKTAWMCFDPSPEAEQEWIEALLTIPNEQGRVVDMKLYPQQKTMLYDRTGRDVTVKGRQTRASSLILARNLRPMVTLSGIKQLVMTQDDQTTTQFRLRIQHHLADLRRNGWDVKTDLDNDDEMVIAGLENHYVFASGQQKTAGRAYTAMFVHLSELSHWPNQERARKLIGDITPAVPGYPHGQFDIESTPNGADGVFYDYTFDAKPQNSLSRWTNHFYPWFLEPRYKAGVEIGADLILSPQEYATAVTRFQPDAVEASLMGEFGLNVDQILWRRFQKREMAKTGTPFLQEYPETLDGCFLAAGDSYFLSPDGIDHLGHYRLGLMDPLLVKESLPYHGGTINFFGPNLRIWAPPQPGQPYVGWVDCAGGGLDERADYTVLTVVNALSKNHVATLRLKCAPNEAGPMVVAVMTYYNTGLLGGERDAYGATTLAVIKELQYPNIFYYVDPTKPRQRVVEAWAHPTQTRERILTSFREDVFSHSFLTRDKQMLGEMGAFTWQKTRGREQLKAAGKGQKDDLVISAAGACFIADQAAAGFRRSQGAPVVVVGANGVVMSRGPEKQTVSPWLR